MGRDTNEAVRRKYIELYQRAAAALGSGKKFRSKAEFRREIGATEMELKTVFRKYPELEEIWNAREIPVRRGQRKDRGRRRWIRSCGMRLRRGRWGCRTGYGERCRTRGETEMDHVTEALFRAADAEKSTYEACKKSSIVPEERARVYLHRYDALMEVIRAADAEDEYERWREGR